MNDAGKFSPTPIDKGPVSVALLAIATVAVSVGALIGVRQSILFIIGCCLGLTLYHASFGFAGSWRRLVVEKRGQGLRAQMLMIGLASIVFIPLLFKGEALGQSLAAATAPAGIAVLVGAAVFGIGMQLGGSCASGTLYTLGGGNVRMLVTLPFFVLGALIGSAHLPWWL